MEQLAAVNFSASETLSPSMRRWLFASLLLWGVGAITLEGVITAGMASTVVAVVFLIWPERSIAGATSGIREWWPLAAFVSWALIVPWLAGHSPSGTGVARIGDWIALPAAVVAFSAMDSVHRRWLAWSIGAVFALSCLAAGLQYRGWWPPPASFDAWRWTRIPFDRVYEPLMGTTNRFAGGGLIFHRLKFSDIGGFAVVGAVAYGWSRRGVERWLAWSVAAFGVIAIIQFAWVRAAGVAILAAIIVMVLTSRMRLLHSGITVGTIAILAGATITFSPGVRDRFAVTFDSGGNGERMQLLSAGLRAVVSAPVAGVGLWRYRPGEFPDAQMAQFVRDHPGKAHNQFISIAAEIGIPGALLFVVLLCWLAMRMRGPGSMAGYGLLVFFAILSLGHDPLFHAPVSMALILALAIAFVTAREARASEPRASSPTES